MIIDKRKPLNSRQLEIFWNELAAIQRRWQLFFTDKQKQTISIEVSEKESILHFSDAYNLPEEVSREIGIIYKMVAEDDDDNVYEVYQMLRDPLIPFDDVIKISLKGMSGE
jgi:hypothetical protein